MKKLTAGLVFLLIVGLALTGVAGAQSHKKTPPQDLRGGGGFKVGIIPLEMKELNNIISSEGFAKLDNTILLYGGGGLGGEKLGHRFGGYGSDGTIKAKKNNKTAILNMGYGGFSYEKGIFARNNFDISVGSMFGGGGMDLTLIHNEPGNFEDVVSGTTENDSPYSVTLTKGFLALEPRVNLHYQFNNYLGIDLSAGYLLTYDMGDNWTLGDNNVEDGPLSNVRSPHLSVQLSYGF